MVSLRKYDKGYEDGKCPYGFEYVNPYIIQQYNKLPLTLWHLSQVYLLYLCYF